MRRVFVILIILAALLPRGASAHGVGVFARVEGGTVHAEGRFGGAPCRNCRVTVTDNETGETLARGLTDEEGMFSFPLPQAAGLAIAIDAGTGHAGRFVLETPGAASSGHMAETGDEVPLTPAMLEEKLAPLRRELRRLRAAAERPGLTEVLGGIGYIVGLLGLAAYMRHRKK